MRGNFITPLQAFWQDLKDSFWLLPAAIALVGPILAVALIKFDRAVGQIDISFLFGESPSSAHYILTTIAGSLITVAGLTFSVTVVTLQLVSTQFTPRVLRGFLSDRVTQITAGGLVGIFGYCLLVLTAVQSAPETGTNFVPAVSLTVAIALAFVGLALLLLFIHHIAQSIQVSNIAARIERDASQAGQRRYPGAAGTPLLANPTRLLRTWHSTGPPALVYATGSGYVNSVGLADLMRAIDRPDLRLHLRVAPGDRPRRLLAGNRDGRGNRAGVPARVHDHAAAGRRAGRGVRHPRPGRYRLARALPRHQRSHHGAHLLWLSARDPRTAGGA